MKETHIPVNIPNILSLYRLFSFPFLMIFIFIDQQVLFAFFIWFNLTTDILDGWIARRFNQTTPIGAKLDGLADTGTYILAITGIFMFKWQDFDPHTISFSVFIALFIASRVIPLIKFGRFYGFQIYSGKIGAYIHGIFFIVLFFWGFYAWFFYIMVISGYILFSETILISLILKENKSHVKGLYWILKERKNQAS
jgi:cardiolipin synthase (CMP-forming)